MRDKAYDFREIELGESVRRGEPSVRELASVVGSLDVLYLASGIEVAHRC